MGGDISGSMGTNRGQGQGDMGVTCHAAILTSQSLWAAKSTVHPRFYSSAPPPPPCFFNTLLAKILSLPPPFFNATAKPSSLSKRFGHQFGHPRAPHQGYG